jgi:hypothetical protein
VTSIRDKVEQVFGFPLLIIIPPLLHTDLLAPCLTERVHAAVTLFTSIREALLKFFMVLFSHFRQISG